MARDIRPLTEQQPWSGASASRKNGPDMLVESGNTQGNGLSYAPATRAGEILTRGSARPGESRTARNFGRLLLVPLLGTLALAATSSNKNSPFQVGIAFLLFAIPWWSYLQWLQDRNRYLPVFALISSVYSLYFAIPLFWGTRQSPIWNAPNNLSVSEGAVTQALLMVLFGISCLWLGMQSKLGQGLMPKPRLGLSSDPTKWNYLRLLLFAGTVASVLEISGYALGEGGRQLILSFQSTIPLVVLVILFRNYLQGNASRFDKVLIGSYLAIRIVVGISSGWSGVLVVVALALLFVYLGERRRAPVAALSVLVLYIVFFQVGKGEFRTSYWYGANAQQSTIFERAGAWVGASLDKWLDALSDPSNGSLAKLARSSVERTSLLTQTANVIELTPAIVPYQNGRLYSFLFVSLVPRLVWPDKPSANDANQFYQIAYNVTPPEGLNGVSLSIGSLTEGYISFGWLGVAVVMFLLGIVLGLADRVFLRHGAGVLTIALGVLLMVQFMQIESQLALYLASILQQVLVSFLILLPALRFKEPMQVRRIASGI